MDTLATYNLILTHKQLLSSKQLELNGLEQTNFNLFITSFQELSKKSNQQIEIFLTLNNTARNINSLVSVTEALKHNFDTLKVFISEKPINNINTDYSSVDFKKFGTTD
ncbi:hypothetical protein SAMN04489761_4251 [Tenacibaculum sp. MAR_2009_124]|uniref:hypothetical protein n=1 Tax=Tenacibaculum sp. MAR_2009_124 TaxID=1250059 RepID=UPI0008989421|nr:hypothetical protein [Tenacibaculum sp. MAR_2009_124]SED09337.1 hypothetical protein SAMN04489761_4251 [Tenacibaculum sp. MAR_2009_124]